MEYIKSKNNDFIKNVKKIASSHKYREETGSFVLEGARLCFDVLKSDYEIEVFLFTKGIQEKYSEECEAIERRSQRSILIADEVAAKLSDTQNTQGIFLVLKEKKQQNVNIFRGKYIAFDSIQNPLNIGAAIRSADALGIDGAICYNCCDVYNPKALRASMGGLLRLPIVFTDDLVNTLNVAKDNDVTVYSSVVSDNAYDIKNTTISANSILVIGNEANGVSKEIIDISDKLVTIKMKSEAESLNALAAASIIMWEMTK